MSEQPGRLLVVDDNEMNRDMLSRRLGRRGFDVAIAPEGTSALEMIASQEFDVVLLDIMMPGIDGMEVLERVRKDKSAADLPIIMATAKSESDDIVRALKLGANDYVTKPLDFPVVLARVNTQFHLKRATDQLRAAHARMKRDLEAAARVQQTLLPKKMPPSQYANFAWTYRPCEELAGDALNVFRISDRLIGLYVLDVSGHGVPASLLSVTATRSLSPHAGESLLADPGAEGRAISPAEVTAKLNELYPMESNGGRYFTLLLGILDEQAQTFRFTCAGHPGPILARQGEGERSLDVSGFPVGMLPVAQYEDTTIELKPGDRLYIHSDGMNEEMNPDGEEFGNENMLAATAEGRDKSLDESVDMLVRKVIAWHGDEDLKDDVSIVAFEVK